MQKSYDYDAIVIGSGPGGEGAAMGLVKQGAKVAVIERFHNIGGMYPLGHNPVKSTASCGQQNY